MELFVNYSDTGYWAVFLLVALVAYPPLLRPDPTGFWHRPRHRVAILAIIVATIAAPIARATLALLTPIRMLPSSGHPSLMMYASEPDFFDLLPAGISVVLALGLALMLGGEWYAQLRNVRREESGLGWQRYFNPCTIVSIAAMALMSGLGFGSFNASFPWHTVSVFALVALVATALLAIAPLLEMMFSPISSSATAADVSPERGRILRLLEEGKINAEESAQLLQALAQTMPKGIIPEGLNGAHRAVLLGAGVVLVGFFLPWFDINMGQQLSEMFGGPEFGGRNVQMPSFGRSTVRMSGGDVAHGLGWIILILSASAALLPYLAPTLPTSTRRSAALLAVAASAVIGIYLLTSGFRWSEYGLWVVLGGCLVQGIGATRSLKSCLR